MRPGAIVQVLAAAVFTAGLSGCAGWHSRAQASHDNPRHDGRLYVVTSATTPVYFHSPRQGEPDQTITRDTPVKMIRPSFSFCKVELLDGRKGFVSNSDIAPATGNIAEARDVSPKPATDPTNASYRAELPEPRPAPSEPPLPVTEPTPLPSPGSGMSL